MRTNKPLQERFLEKIDLDDETGCWLWTRYIDRSGYGRFHRPTGSPLAHRYAYEEFAGNGPVPEGMHLDHLCGVRHCVNPEHLEVVTPLENFRRGNSFAAINLRKTHCDKGHALAGDNVKTVRTVRVERVCLTCERARKRAYKHRQHAKGIAA
jgi:hypothetical protein